MTPAQVVANGEIADAPATAANLADLLSLDADDAAEASATASSAVTALQDLLSGDLSAEVAAAGNLACIFTLSGVSALDKFVLDTAAPETGALSPKVACWRGKPPGNFKVALLEQ